MELNSLSSSTALTNSATLQNQVGISMLKKAQDADAQMAAQLIQSLPQPSSAHLPLHLGQTINTKA